MWPPTPGTFPANLRKKIAAFAEPGSASLWISMVCRLSGVVSLVVALRPPVLSRLEALAGLAPLTVELPTRIISIQAALLLLVLAHQLELKKRRAWYLTLIAATLGLAGSVARGVELPSAIGKVALIALLIGYRKEFFAEPDPLSIRRALRFVPTYLVGVGVYASSTSVAYRHSIEGELTVANVVVSTARGLVGSEGPLTMGHPMTNEFFYASLVALGAAGLGALVYTVFRPVAEGVNSGESERRLARAIVKRWGSDSLDYFSLRYDKSYFFSDSGDAFIAYRYVNGVACISGDPIGDPDKIEPLLGRFIEWAHRKAWRVAVLAGEESNGALYAPVGLKSFYIGDEALIDLEVFSLEGRAIRKVRQSCHRMEKKGYRFELFDASRVDAEMRLEMDAISRRWRGRAPNRGFSMALNRDFEEADSECIVAVVRNSSGALKGFMKFAPFYGKNPGYSLDQESREPDAPNGLSEYLVAQTCLVLQKRGLKYLSLNFAAFSRLLSGEVPLTLRQKLQRMVVKALNPWFQIESLYRFNKEFFPVWQPRALFYEEGSNVVRVALSYMELEAFLRLGWIRRRWLFPPLDMSR